MVTVARGPAPLSRGSQIGQALGTGFSSTFGPGVIQANQSIQEQNRLNPLREALLASLGEGGPVGAGQQLIQQVASSPELFAQFISNPQQLSSVSSLVSASQPTTGFAVLDEIERTLSRAQEFADQGETNRARILTGRANDLAGIEANLDPKLKLLQLQRPGSNTTEIIQSDERGNFKTAQGEDLEIPEGAMVFPLSQITGTTEDVLGTSEQEELRSAQVDTETFLSTVNDTLTLLAESPDVNTLVGRGASFINDLQAEALAAGRLAGVEFDPTIFDPATNEVTFDRLGIQNREMQSLITSLAFQAAAAAAPGDRVTERDVQRFIQEIGAGAADPRAFASVLTNLARRTQEGFLRNFQTRQNEAFTGDLGLSQLPNLSTLINGGQGTLNGPTDDTVDQLSPDEVSNLTDTDLFNF